jgi:hypothetical protein
MRQSSLVVSTVLVLSCALAHAQSTVRGNASGQSQTEVSGSNSGASASNSSAGSAHTALPGARGDVAGGNEMNATLTKPLDAGKNKPGDEVTAVAADDMKSNGQVMVPKGSKLFGHVTSAKPQEGAKGRVSNGGAAADGSQNATAATSAAGNAASELGVVFDKAVLKDGREIPLHAAVQAIAAGAAASSADLSGAELATFGAGGGMAAGRASGGGLFGGARGTVGGAVGTTAGLGGFGGSTLAGSARIVERSAGAVGGLSPVGRITSGSRGVFGMPGLDIASAGAESAEGSLVTSGIRTVRLERGTRMLLVTQSAAADNASGSASGVSGLSGAVSASGSATGETSATTGSASDSSATRARRLMESDTDRR